MTRERRRATLIAQVAVVAALAGVWEVIGRARSDLSDSIPTFSATSQALGRVIADQQVWTATGQTLRSTLLGLALCAVVGVGAGLLIASHRFFTASTRFVVDFSRTIPPLAIVPLFLLLFGPTSRMEVLLVFAVGVWPVLLQTVYGVRGVDPEMLKTARSFRIPRWRRALFVIIPAATPYVATGIRICATLSLLLAIGTELIAGVPGLGQEIVLSQQAGDAPRMFAQILVTGALGAIISLLISMGETRLLGWHYRPRAAVT